jgi:two-component system CheB/CheR fusion protein
MPDDPVTQLVVIGASAGGIDALSTLVATLPADCPAPIVIGQHLSPDRLSHLPEILSARSTLPIEVVDSSQRLRAGVVYVVPANQHVEITDHTVTLARGGDPGPKPSIDLLMMSAADVFGENLVAVILTGLGADGAAGARVVKASGGTVIIQNPETASFPAMPRSLAPTTVDIVAELEAIGPLLGELLSRGGQLPDEQQGDDLSALLEEIRERSGIDFSAYKMPTIQRRLQRRMVANRVSTIAEYAALLAHNPDEYQRLANSFLIKVTEFFRDPELFAYLKTHILPDLIAAAKRRGELRLWSAGCATGEEAYSLAILVADMLGESPDVNVRIFATDLDAEAVSFARQGIYPSAAMTNVPPEYIERFFFGGNEHYEVNNHVRSMIVFGQHDLGQRAPFPRIDLVCCRNVLIYFTPDLQRRALQLFALSLRDRGYLVLGKAETVSPLPDYFEPVDTRQKVFRRVGERIIVPMTRLQPLSAAQLPQGAHVRRTRAVPGATYAHVSTDATPHTPAAAMAAGVVQQLPLGVVVVDRRYQIQLINSVARRLLGVHRAAMGEDLIHLVQHVPLLPLREAINDAFRSMEATLQAQVNVTDAATSQLIDLEITCLPDPIDRERASVETVTITILDISRFVGDVRQREEELAQVQEQFGQLRSHAEQVLVSHRSILEANDELTSIIAELQNENEELVLAIEEAQSTTEEVETLNEEMQATNEELETLNEELQATIEELNTTNDDLHSRSLEMQELTVSLEEQRLHSEAIRRQLVAILDSLEQPLAVVGSDEQTKLTNAAFDRLFGGIGQGNVSGETSREIEALIRRAAAGEQFTTVVSADGHDGVAQRFEARSATIGEPDSDWRSVMTLTPLPGDAED